MTTKIKTRPRQLTSPTPSEIGHWLMVAAILVALVLLAFRVVNVVGDQQIAPIDQATPAAETSVAQWALEQELDAIRAGTVVSQSRSVDWTLDDELAAIRGNIASEPTQSTDRPSGSRVPWPE